jgi:hypothetical protein
MSETSNAAAHRMIAASMIYEAKTKEHQAACWMGLPTNIEEARAALHSALDAMLDATENQIIVVKAGAA